MCEEHTLQLVDPFARRARHGDDADDTRIVQAERGSSLEEVDLVQHDELRAVGEAGAIGAELSIDRVEAMLEIGLGGVDDMNEEAGALEVSEELVAEPGAVRRALR